MYTYVHFLYQGGARVLEFLRLTPRTTQLAMLILAVGWRLQVPVAAALFFSSLCVVRYATTCKARTS